MILRIATLLIAISAISLTAFNKYNSPKDYSETIADCRNDKLAPDDAILACTKLIERPDISNENLHFFLGKRAWAFRRADDFKSAISDIDRALELQPNNINMWVRRAYINDASGAIKTAAEDFKKALELDPSKVSTLMHRAKFYFFQGTYSKARRDYETVVKIQPNNYTATTSIVAIHIKRKNYDLAIDALERAAITWPDDPKIQRMLGVLYFHYLGDYSKSLKVFSALVQLVPDNYEDRLHLAAVHYHLGNDSIAEKNIERIVEQIPQRTPSAEDLFSATVGNIIKSELFGETPQHLYRAILFSVIGKADLARKEFQYAVDNRNITTPNLVRNLLIKQGYCPNTGCNTFGDADFTEAINKYIEDRRESFILDSFIDTSK